jgi:hypothetical protein
MLYYQFLSNIVKRGHQDMVVPLPTDSLSAAGVLKHLSIEADLIYIDGNHHFQLVMADIFSFNELLSDDGVMFGHDYTWPSVKQAVNFFSAQHKRNYEVQGDFWIIKPPSP